ncbi:hypothetical protein [Bacillus sp. 2205SS5-2]
MGKKYYKSINHDHVLEGESCIFYSQLLDSSSVNVVEANFKHAAHSKKGL